jgi:shikimate kinase
VNLPIVITGFMGCGKTEVARCLATQLDAAVVDLDQVITARVGRSPARLIAEDGERAFRTIETAILREVLATSTAGVIALGGGAWIEAANRQLIGEAGGTTIWLDTSFELCWERIETSGDDRPLGKSRDQALKLFELRLPTYALANMRITTTTNETPTQIASRIVNEIQVNPVKS